MREGIGAPDRPTVPWRTIWATVLAVAVTYEALQLLQGAARIVTWVIVAVFLAVALGPLVDRVERRFKARRGVAVAVVVLLFLLVLVGTVTAFVLPVVRQLPSAIGDLPTTIDAAGRGRGPLGDLVTRLHLQRFVEQNGPRLQSGLNQLGSSSLTLLRSVAGTLLAVLTIMVLTVLFLLQGPKLCAGIDEHLVPRRHQDRVRAVARESVAAVSGYMVGNVLISIIAGVAALVVLLAFGVPSAVVLAAWVAFADLIPLVGATLGAAPAVAVAFLHSTVAGIGVLIFFIIYQQFENHALQTTVMARTVKVSALVVLLSALIGAQLFGFVGAMLAIPAAGVAQVVVKEWWTFRRERVSKTPLAVDAAVRDETPATAMATATGTAVAVSDRPDTRRSLRRRAAGRRRRPS